MRYLISGKIIKGDGYGKKIGFPTVNLETKNNLPPVGVYVGMGILDGKEYRAGIVMGPNDKIEAHLLKYEGNAYGKSVTLEVKNFLRKYKKFKNEADLIKQIKSDIELIANS